MSDKNQLPGLRAKLTDACEQRWSEQLKAAEERSLDPDVPVDELRSGADGGRNVVVLTGVDYTNQCECVLDDEVADRAILHRLPSGRYVAVQLDATYSLLAGKLREAQRELGFARDERWHVMARVVADYAVPMDFFGPEEEDPHLGVVSAIAIRVPGQLAVFRQKDGPIVPGFGKVVAKLEEGEAERKEAKYATPELLLAALLEVLGAADRRSFDRLWPAGTSESDLRYSYKQMIQAREACGGNVAIDRFDREPAEEPAEGDQCRMFVVRSNRDGSSVTRPLTLVFRDGGWRLSGGML